MNQTDNITHPCPGCGQEMVLINDVTKMIFGKYPVSKTGNYICSKYICPDPSTEECKR